jgi:uncharacterized membrane protein YjfL (UPF0719 family)
MSTDEVIVTIASLFIGPLLWSVWLFQMSRVRAAGGRQRSGVRLIGLALGVSIAVILYVLNTASSFDVVDAPMYQFMYLVMGLAWLRLASAMFPFAGVSPRDDAMERGNRAAGIAVAGGLVGVACCYAGANVGDGPGWWVVVFSAALATATLMLVWIALTELTPIADAVTIDRDAAAGVRLAALLASCGLLLGRGVAGDWFSAFETIADFLAALPPVFAIAVLAIVIERVARPTAARPRTPIVAFGLLPATVSLAIAIGALQFMRWPE